MSGEPIQIVDRELSCPKCAGSIEPFAPPQAGVCEHGHPHEVFSFRCLDCEALVGLVFEAREGGGTLIVWADPEGVVMQPVADDRLMN